MIRSIGSPVSPRDASVVGLVLGMKRLPTLPPLCMRISDALRDDSRSMSDIGDLVSQDVGLTAKVLQVVNSALFALPRTVATPGEAAVVLGVDVLHALVLGSELFSSMDSGRGGAGVMNELWSHSLDVACTTRTIAQLLDCPRRTADAAFLAGIVHEIGRVVFLLNGPQKYQTYRREVSTTDRQSPAVEMAIFGATHELVGACLLDSWGLQEEVVTSVAWHRRPSERPDPAIDTLCLLHLADNLVPNTCESGQPGLDAGYLVSVGLADRVPEIVQWIVDRRILGNDRE